MPRRWRGEKWDAYSKWSDVRKGFSPQLWQDSRVRWCGLRTAQWPGHRQVGATVHLALCPPCVGWLVTLLVRVCVLSCSVVSDSANP